MRGLREEVFCECAWMRHFPAACSGGCEVGSAGVLLGRLALDGWLWCVVGGVCHGKAVEAESRFVGDLAAGRFGMLGWHVAVCGSRDLKRRLILICFGGFSPSFRSGLMGVSLAGLSCSFLAVIAMGFWLGRFLLVGLGA